MTATGAAGGQATKQPSTDAARDAPPGAHTATSHQPPARRRANARPSARADRQAATAAGPAPTEGRHSADEHAGPAADRTQGPTPNRPTDRPHEPRREAATAHPPGDRPHQNATTKKHTRTLVAMRRPRKDRARPCERRDAERSAKPGGPAEGVAAPTRGPASGEARPRPCEGRSEGGAAHHPTRPDDKARGGRNRESRQAKPR